MLPRTNKYFYKVPRQPGKIFTVDLKNSPSPPHKDLGQIKMLSATLPRAFLSS
jgi:hypothetical protein